MTLVPFPSIEPIAEEGGRELKLGRFPNRRYEPPNGGSATVRSFGALSVDASLRISFGVITDAQMAEVWAAYDAAQGDYKPLTLPEKFFFGIRAELLEKIPSTLEWHFAPGPLSYEQVAPGYTRLDPITFVGQLAEQYLNHGGESMEPPEPGFGADGAWVGSGTCAEGIDWEADPGGGGAPTFDIIYSQSSVNAGNTAADFNSMTNGVFAESTQTGTDLSDNEWIQMDVGATRNITSIVIGCDFDNTLAGGWGKEYTEGNRIVYRTDTPSGFNDISEWTIAFTVPILTAGITVFPVSFSARYIRMWSPVEGYRTFSNIAATELYVTAST